MSKPTATLAERISALNPIEVVGVLPESLSGIWDDSREVRPPEEQGSGLPAFVAIGTGLRVNGHRFVDAAIERGARVVFHDEVIANLRNDVTYVRLASTRNAAVALGELAYGNPSLEMYVVGITGTNGKTSSTYILESMGKALGLRVGVIGTISHRWPGYEEVSVNTTPSVLKVANLLHGMKNHVDFAAIEVSSHGLKEGRLDGVLVNTAVWTNLSQDHLDYHETMEDYCGTKLRLFGSWLQRAAEAGKNTRAVLNLGDETARQMVRAEVPPTAEVVWYGLDTEASNTPEISSLVGTDHRLAVSELVVDRFGAQGTATLNSGPKVVSAHPFALPLVGGFNVENYLGCVGALLAEPRGLEDGDEAEEPLGLLRGLGSLLAQSREVVGAPGRMQQVRVEGAPLAYVDYAHTPDALVKAIDTLRNVTSGRVLVVFGAGGDRDPSKRDGMGRAGARADIAIVTSDNPRTEDPAAIAAMVASGVRDANGSLEIVLDRRAAIRRAVDLCDADDVVLIAGKGHEPYQEVMGVRHKMDDVGMARAALAAVSGQS